MTHDEFIKRLDRILDSPVCFPNLLEHAKKLVVLAETSKKIIHAEWTLEEYNAFKQALENLERE